MIHVTHQKKMSTMHLGRISNRKNGGLAASTCAESMDDVTCLQVATAAGVNEEGGQRGKRKKTANCKYKDFARHWDEEGSDVE